MICVIHSCVSVSVCTHVLHGEDLLGRLSSNRSVFSLSFPCRPCGAVQSNQQVSGFLFLPVFTVLALYSLTSISQGILIMW